MRTSFNDDKTNRGLEGWYEHIGETMFIYVSPTNCRKDWLSNFLFLPVPKFWTSLKEGFVHLGYKRYAAWLQGFIEGKKLETTNKVVVIAYSMGGGVAQMLDNVTAVSIDGPRTTSKRVQGTVYYKPGALVWRVVPWFPAMSTRIRREGKLQTFWEAHYWTTTEIEEIIELSKRM